MGRFLSIAYRMGAFCVLAGMILVVGCGEGSLSAPSNPDPFLYVVISPEPLPKRFSSTTDSSIQALLLTTGSATGAPFRHAERFELTSLADGSTFTFTERNSSAQIPGVGRQGASLEDGNYTLPFASSPAGKGANELKPLGVYEIHVETGGRLITGRVLIPDRPRPEIFVDGEKRFVVFPPVAGAAAYFVSGDTELYEGIVTGTTIQLFYDVDPGFVPPTPEFRVIALDSNVVRYMSDTTRSTSGIAGAFGLFGAASSARIPVPWP